VSIILKHVLTLTIFLLLSACGGGGGGASPPKPSIQLQPTSQTVYETQQYQFSAAASVEGGTVAYQWYKNGVVIPGATSDRITISSAEITDNNARFSIKVISSFNTEANSSEAVLTVKQAAPVISTAPTPQTIYSGSSARFTVAADGLPPLRYQWYKNGNAIQGANTSEYNSPTLVNYNDGDLYSVEVINARGQSTTSVQSSVTVAPQALGDLTISEVSSCFYINIDCWFEIFNPTQADIDLSKYKINVSALVSGANAPAQFQLPAIIIPSGKYFIVSSNFRQDTQRGSQIVYVGTSTNRPFWRENGFVELLNAGGNKSIDFVRFGSSTQAPITANHWTGSSVAALTTGQNAYGYSIVRSFPVSADTNSSSDWTAVSWSTPGGRNDVPPSAVDSDNDGIPDSSEVPGGTFAGLDLYAMGARSGVKDIFIEIDYMDSNDPGVIPRIESLQKVSEAFLRKGIKVHFDVGDLFSNSFSQTSFNLGQGIGKIPFERCIHLTKGVCSQNSSDKTTLYDWKTAHMDLPRRSIFHYAIFGYTLNSNGSGNGSSGIAETPGNDFIVSMGNWGLSTSSEQNLNFLINAQAGTLMHELGHNLGLQHGGDSDIQYKPNYFSVMNYLYQFYGLVGSPNSSNAYTRWRMAKGDGTPSLCSLPNSPCGSPSQFIIDFSDGTSLPLNEWSIFESNNIGRGSSAGSFADWNMNGVLNSNALSLDLNGDGQYSILTDYNDWGNLILPFIRHYYASSGVSQLKSDKIDNKFNPIVNDQSAKLSNCEPISVKGSALKRHIH